jgi:hypothetical protein
VFESVDHTQPIALPDAFDDIIVMVDAPRSQPKRLG